MHGNGTLARGKVVLCTALCACLAGGAPALAAQARAVPVSTPAAALARHVVVISIDGLRPDAIEVAGAQNLQRLMREGAWTLRAQTILPSKTLPSHTSMLTGVPPAVHGITWNENQVSRTGTVRVPTVFDLAEARGLTTAAFFGKEKFRHLIRDETPHFRVAPRGDEVWRASVITQQVEQYLRFRTPDLLFVHLPDPDLAGHLYGWMSLPYRMAVRRADAAVGRLVEAVEEAFGGDAVVIVTADHGGHGHGHGSAEVVDQTIPWIVWGRGIAPGELAGEVHTFDTAATALWALGVPLPEQWSGRPVASAFGLAGIRHAAAPPAEAAAGSTRAGAQH
jgi:arylsulfatase A-like enzyme